MKHYGVWFNGGWMQDTRGIIFWTTSLHAAEVQAKRSGGVVREFDN